MEGAHRWKEQEILARFV